MANSYIKAASIVQAAVLLLERDIVLPRLVWTQPEANFYGALDDTITLRVPAVLTTTNRAMRSDDQLVAQTLTETSVPVKLDRHIYSLLNIRDEELTLDIRDFAAQVLSRQMRAVAEGAETVIASAITGATWEADPVDFAEGTDKGYDVLIKAGRELNKLNVPRSERVFLCGANVEAALFADDRVVKANEAATDSALREATIARLAGFTVVGSNAIDPDDAYAFHRTAIAFANVAPALPEGAAMKARTATESFALRYLRDYDPTASNGPVDRTLVDAFVGAVSIEDGATASVESNKRGVEIDFTPEGS